MCNYREVGLNPERLKKLQEEARKAVETGADNNNNVVDKTAWFTPPEGIEKWAPTKAGYYHFDVLQMHMLRDNYEMRKITGERSFNQNADNYWFDRQVTVHGAYPMYLPCANTFGVELERNEEGKWYPKAKDSICKYIHENYPAVTPRQVNLTYSIMLLRLHNIGEDGNTTYKYVFYVDTHGKFANILYDEYKQMLGVSLDENAFFYTYGKLGKTVKARFAELQKELPASNGGTSVAKWIGCNKIDFVDRKDPLTDADLEFISKIEVDNLIKHPTAEEYDLMCAKISGKSVGQTRPAPVRETHEAERTKGSYNVDEDLDKVFGKEIEEKNKDLFDVEEDDCLSDETTDKSTSNDNDEDDWDL